MDVGILKRCQSPWNTPLLPVKKSGGTDSRSQQTEYSCEYGSVKFYVLCGFGGVLSCGLTHTAVVPLDLVKCRMQVDPQKYKGIFNGFSVTLKENGFHSLAKGWAPTFIGYSLQGLCKFGFYDSNMFGEENAYLWRTSLYLAASASAEFFADIALAPMEAAKVRIQTQPGYANTLRDAAPKIQITYTMMKFTYFERTVADSVVSVLNKEKGSSVWKGLFARIIMIGTLTALQWFIYDSVKVYFRLPRPPPPEMPESLKKKLGYTL
ncbi:hypothetical protein FD755_015698 [Muntiacus reevesi]|uniref:Solute carrier family 25 member 3 n=1 Tax=Muntiacus reevesi TaxID=9886 RepID=A0A5N3XKE8_MUNRE|nr:hypothetical protein FD755_015698 [Muntiacus reevesi]